jgi:hypothetical protein
MPRFTIFGPKGRVVGRGTAQAVAKALRPLLAKFRWVRVQRQPLPPSPLPVTMYDSIDVAQIPADAQAVAGYVNGRWPTWTQVVKQFPTADKLSIDVNGTAYADCLDVEKGDANPTQVPGWVKRQWGHGAKRPAVYGSLSEWPQIELALQDAGIKRSEIRVWTAHYTGREHRCSAACGFGFTGVADATQWTDKALGRNLDASLCSPTFFTP